MLFEGCCHHLEILKRAAKRSAEAARSSASVSGQAITVAQTGTEIIAWGRALSRSFAALLHRQTIKNAKEACRTRVSVSRNGNWGNRRTSDRIGRVNCDFSYCIFMKFRYFLLWQCDRILISLLRAWRSIAEVLPSLLMLQSVVGKSVCFLK